MIDALFEPTVVLATLAMVAVPVLAGYGVVALLRSLRARWVRRP